MTSAEGLGAARCPGAIARKYYEIMRVSLQNSMTYLYDVFFRALFLVVVIFIFVQLWRTTYGATESTVVAGLTLRRMIWYLVLTESIILSRPRKVLEISDDVKSGAIAYALGKPYSYVLFHYFRFLGETAARFPVNLLVGGMIATVMVGPIYTSLISLPAVVIAVLLAITIDFFLSMAIGLLAFWVEDTTAFFWIYEKMLFTIGGMLVPLEIFPPLLQKISRALPFNLIVYGPARLLVDFSLEGFGRLVASQMMWGVVLFAAAHIVFSLGAKRVSIHGG